MFCFSPALPVGRPRKTHILKKIAKTGAAFGLAALTLASSLTMGAAASASPAPTAASTLAADHYSIPFVVRNADGTYFGLKEDGYRSADGTFEAARAVAEMVQIPKLGTTGSILSEDGKSCWFNGQQGGRVLQRWPYDTNGYCAVNNGWGSQFYVEGDGTLVSTKNPGFRLQQQPVGPRAKFDTVAAGVVESKLVATAAETLSVDVYDRTAVVAGRAQPGATVAIKGGSTNKTVQADAETGEWTTTVRGLALGENPFTLEAFDEKGDSLGSSEFTVDVPITPLSAAVQSTSVFAGTAVVEVTGTPGLSLDYQNKDVTLNRDGKATVLVDGLSQGANTVRFQQYEAGKQIGGDLEYDIRVTARNIVAQAAFDDRGIDHDAILSGTAEAQADITIVDGNDKVTTTTADADGAWSTPVTAPGSGLQNFEASQSIKGMAAGSTDVRLNYGNAVEITSPGNNTPWAGGDLTFRGDGQYTAPVEITEKGNDTVVASTVGVNNGSWTAKVTGVDGDHKHTFTATMRSKGNLTTTDTIVVNADKDEAETAAPVAVTNPTNVADGYTPDAPFTFEGTGTKGKTITVENKFGTHIATTTVGDNGQWSWTRANMGTSIWNLNFIQDKGQTSEAVAKVDGFKPRA